MPDRPPRPGAQPSEKLVSTVSVAAICLIFATSVLGYAWDTRPDPGSRILTIALLFGIVGLQLGVVSNPAWQPRRRVVAGAVLALGVFALAPMGLYGQAWAGMVGFVAADLVMLWPDRRGLLASVAVTVIAAVGATASPEAGVVPYTLVVTALIGCLVYGLSLLRTTAADLDVSRDELAARAVAHSRAEAGEQLHELIATRLEQVSDLLAGGVVASGLTEVSDLARAALADMRAYARTATDGRPASIASAPAPAAWAGMWLVRAVLVGSFAIDVLHVVTGASWPGRGVVVVVALIAGMTIQLAAFTGTPKAGVRRLARTLPAQLACLAVVVVAGYPDGATAYAVAGFGGVVAGVALLTLPRLAGLGIWAALLATTVLVHAPANRPLADWYAGVMPAVTRCLATWGLLRLLLLVAERRKVAAELTQVAVAEESVRVARDVHDLLGYSLSALALKADLARRLAPADASRAAREVREMAALAAQARRDLGAVTGGPPTLDLGDELASVGAALAQAGVRADVARRVEGLDAAGASLAALVVREGVTNVLRHARASRCRITLSAADGVWSVDVTNDGVEGEPSAPGVGLTSLRHRLELAGGRLEAGSGPAGTYRLRAEAPLVHAAANP